MVRKKLVVLTAVTLAASLALAGCGTTSSSAGSSDEAEKAVAEAAAAANEAAANEAAANEAVAEEAAAQQAAAEEAAAEEAAAEQAAAQEAYAEQAAAQQAAAQQAAAEEAAAQQAAAEEAAAEEAATEEAAAQQAVAEEAAAQEASDIAEAGEEAAGMEETVGQEPGEEESPVEEASEGLASYDVDDLSEKQENMLGPMDTIATCQDEDGPTDYEDAEEVWTAVYLLVVNYSDLFEGRIEYEGNSLYVTEDVLDECASAMFADFDGTLPEGDMGNITKDGDRYCLPGSDRGDSYARISSWTDNPDGTCTVEIQELTGSESESEDESEDEITQEYRIELVENTYAGTDEDALFAYSVASVEQTFRKQMNEYILPESDSRYYTEEELSSLSPEDLRIARNEIYARHGRRFDSEDLQTYFDSQAWYEGTVDPSDFDSSVFNEFESANVRTIEQVEEQADNSSD